MHCSGITRVRDDDHLALRDLSDNAIGYIAFQDNGDYILPADLRDWLNTSWIANASPSLTVKAKLAEIKKIIPEFLLPKQGAGQKGYQLTLKGTAGSPRFNFK